MKAKLGTKAISVTLTVAMSSLLPNAALAQTPQPPPSQMGITPKVYPGNFVSSDDEQVCYDLVKLGYIGEVTAEMRGFKIDPPTGYKDANVDFKISNDGRYLEWESANAQVLGVVVKGGPNYTVYDYVGTGIKSDALLRSPIAAGRTQPPAISHYNVCYKPEPPAEFQGCTPGYWRNHANRWVGVNPGDDFDTTFGVDLFNPNITLGTAIWASGGGNNALARHATAALLNAYAQELGSNGQSVNYQYTVEQVKQMVQDAVANGTIEETKNLFETANEKGCPLSGTPAVEVPR